MPSWIVRAIWVNVLVAGITLFCECMWGDVGGTVFVLVVAILAVAALGGFVACFIDVQRSVRVEISSRRVECVGGPLDGALIRSSSDICDWTVGSSRYRYELDGDVYRHRGIVKGA